MTDASWIVPEEARGEALSTFVRKKSGGAPWSRVKRWIATGKVLVDGDPVLDPGLRLAGGERVSLAMAAPRPDRAQPPIRIVYEDRQVVVVDKPAGVSSVPYEPGERGTAMDLLREAWRPRGAKARSAPIFVVHRLDKATSGLLAFARTKAAERALGKQLREHSVERLYLCVVHGALQAARIESRLVADRGDRLRGSTRTPGRGKRAVTHVRPIRRLRGATLCEVRLETGRTHQIRVHLSERGHPVVGDPVYTRDFLREGRELIEAPRLLLHAATLGFSHPSRDEFVRLESPIPDEMQAVIDALDAESGTSSS